MLCVADFEEHARKVLNKEAWEFYAGGANDEQTLRDNVQAFSRLIMHTHTHKGQIYVLVVGIACARECCEGSLILT